MLIVIAALLYLAVIMLGVSYVGVYALGVSVGARRSSTRLHAARQDRAELQALLSLERKRR